MTTTREVTKAAGQAIHKLRRESNYTIRELANAMGMRWQKLKRFEDADREVPLVVLVDISDVLDYPPETLIKAILEEVNVHG